MAGSVGRHRGVRRAAGAHHGSRRRSRWRARPRSAPGRDRPPAPGTSAGTRTSGGPKRRITIARTRHLGRLGWAMPEWWTGGPEERVVSSHPVMRVLIVGGGGREHALAHALAPQPGAAASSTARPATRASRALATCHPVGVEDVDAPGLPGELAARRPRRRRARGAARAGPGGRAARGRHLGLRAGPGRRAARGLEGLREGGHGRRPACRPQPRAPSRTMAEARAAIDASRRPRRRQGRRARRRQGRRRLRRRRRGRARRVDVPRRPARSATRAAGS